MALLESYYIAKCCYYVFGSYLQGPLVKGELGGVYAVIALGTQFMTMNKQELAAFKQRVEGEGKLWEQEGKLENYSKFQAIEFVSDKGITVVCTKSWNGEGSSVVEWRNSSFLGGTQLDPDRTVPVVQIDGSGGEHGFAKVLIKHCSKKLAAVEAHQIVCVRSGLNDLASSVHLLSVSEPSRALLDILKPVRAEVFLSASTRSHARYAPPTLEQHTSTGQMLRKLIEIGSEALVHQKKDGNAPTNSATGALAHTAEECSDRAFAFVKAVLEGTVDNGETFSPCQFVTPTPLTEMQEATALVISKPGGAAKAVAYLTPRVGAKHVADLKAFGRELAQRKNEILALAAKAAAPSGSTGRKRRRSA